MEVHESSATLNATTIPGIAKSNSTELESQRYLEVTTQISWIVSLSLTSVIISVNSWIIIAFLLYKSKLFIKKSGKDVNGGWVFKTSLVAVCLPMFRYFTSLAVLFVSLDAQNHTWCEVTRDLGVCAVFVCFVSVAIFLWTKQRAFYGHPSLGPIFGKWVERLSRASLVLTILGGVVALSLALFPTEYKSGPTGCVLREGNGQYEFRKYVYGAVLVLSQVLLIGLFIYPVHIHYKKQKRPGIARESISTRQKNVVSQKQSSKRDNQVYALIKRTLILACIYVTSGLLLTVVLTRVLPQDAPQYLFTLVYDVVVLTNVISIVVSFEHWKAMLAHPFLCCSGNSNTPDKRESISSIVCTKSKSSFTID